jgi:hypothetical protein
MYLEDRTIYSYPTTPMPIQTDEQTQCPMANDHPTDVCQVNAGVELWSPVVSGTYTGASHMAPPSTVPITVSHCVVLYTVCMYSMIATHRSWEPCMMAWEHGNMGSNGAGRCCCLLLVLACCSFWDPPAGIFITGPGSGIHTTISLSSSHFLVRAPVFDRRPLTCRD